MKKLKQITFVCGLFLTAVLSTSVFAAPTLPTIRLHGTVENLTLKTVQTVTMGFPLTVNSGENPSFQVHLFEQPRIEVTYRDSTNQNNDCEFDFIYQGKNRWDLTAISNGQFKCRVAKQQYGAAHHHIKFNASKAIRLLLI